MAASATNIFSMAGIQPAFSPWGEAKRISVKLPVSIAYVKGTILGEIVGTNEVQTFTLTTGGTLGGTYTLAFGGVATSALAFSATAATVQAALEALTTIGVNNVVVTGTTPTTSGGVLTISFQNALGKQDLGALVPDATSLTGTTPGAVITTGTAGSGTTNEVQTIYKSGTVSGGTFTITYSGQTTTALAYNATTAVVQTALEALSNILPGGVQVTGTANSVYILTFGGSSPLKGTDVAAVTIGNGSITGGGSYLVATASAGAAGSNGSYKAFLSSSTDGSQTAKAILEFDCATDSAGLITLGTASGGGDKQQTFNVVPAFISGTFKCEDLQQTAGAGQFTDLAVSHMGRILEGSVTAGLFSMT